MKNLLFLCLLIGASFANATDYKRIIYQGQSSNTFTMQDAITESESYEVDYDDYCPNDYSSPFGSDDCSGCGGYGGAFGTCSVHCQVSNYTPCTKTKTEYKSHLVGKATAKVNVSYVGLGNEMKGKEISFVFDANSGSVYVQNASFGVTDFVVAEAKKTSSSNLGKSDKSYSFSISLKRKSSTSLKLLMNSGLGKVMMGQDNRHVLVYLPAGIDASDFSYSIVLSQSKLLSKKMISNKKLGDKEYSVSKTSDATILMIDVYKLATSQNMSLESGKKYTLEFSIDGMKQSILNFNEVYKFARGKNDYGYNFFHKLSEKVKFKIK